MNRSVLIIGGLLTATDLSAQVKTDFEIHAHPDSLSCSKTGATYSDHWDDERISLSSQLVYLYQVPLQCSNSKRGLQNGKATVLVDLPLIIRPWKNTSFNITPQFATGNAVNEAVGMGGYVNALYGQSMPFPYILRANVVQKIKCKDTFFLKDLQLTFGKACSNELFDTNPYAGNPALDFLNFNHIMPSAWDLASTAFGNGLAAAVKLNFSRSQINFAAITVSREAGGLTPDKNIREAHSFNLQFVKRIRSQLATGSIRLTGFYNKTFSIKYSDYFTDSLQSSNETPGSLKKYRGKYGFIADVDLALSKHLALFGRYSWNDGQTEAMHFTEADRSFCLGASLCLSALKRSEDIFGISLSVNSLSREHREYLMKGGQGFMLKNGCEDYGKEGVIEAIYTIKVTSYLQVSFDYQHMVNTGYTMNTINDFLGTRLTFIY
jgi:high affinity Mn2+ porin